MTAALMPSGNRFKNAHHITYGRVIKVDPRRATIDVALANGSILRRVPILTPGSGDHGKHVAMRVSAFRPTESEVLNERGDPVATAVPTRLRDCYAIIAYLGGHLDDPVCMGFLPPTSWHLYFDEEGISMERMPNGSYLLGDMNHNVELVFPDGSFLRFGAGTAKRDLVGKDANKRFAHPFSDPDHPLPASPNVQLKHVSGAEVRLAPDGKVYLISSGGAELLMDELGNVDVTSPGATRVNGVAVASVAQLHDEDHAARHGSVGADALALGNLAGQVGTPQIAGLAVTTAKIADDAITSDKLAGGQPMQLIAEEVLSALATTIDFQSIPGTYGQLLLVFQGRIDLAAQTSNSVLLRVNNDSGSNYDRQWHNSGGSTMTATEQLAATGAYVTEAPAANAAADKAGFCHVWFPFYAQTTFHKHVLSHSHACWNTTTGTGRTMLSGTTWRSTAAINRLTLIAPGGSNFVVGSAAALYGLPKAA